MAEIQPSPYVAPDEKVLDDEDQQVLGPLDHEPGTERERHVYSAKTKM